MLATIDRHPGMPDEERLLFRPGRRGGALRLLNELNDPRVRQRLRLAVRDLPGQTGGSLEEIIKELADQYI